MIGLSLVKARRKLLKQGIILFVASALLQRIVWKAVIIRASPKTHINDTIRSNLLIFNGQPFHDEVYMGFLESFSKINEVNTSLLIQEPRWNMRSLMDSLIWENHLESIPFPSEEIRLSHIPQTISHILDITCGSDITKYEGFFNDLLEKTSIFLYCVVHHADTFSQETREHAIVSKWITLGRVRLIALSNHVGERLYEHWDTLIKPVGVIVPIFTISNQDHKDQTDKDQTDISTYYTVQGYAGRRDYTNIFQSIEELLSGKTYSGDTELPKLRILGNGKIHIPSTLKDQVVQIKGLDYPEFYENLAGSIALIPAIEEGPYTIDSASSTFPASIIAGVPVVITQTFLNAYTYLPRSAVILQEETESPLEALLRFQSLSQRKKNLVYSNLLRLRAKLQSRNREALLKWISEDQQVNN